MADRCGSDSGCGPPYLRLPVLGSVGVGANHLRLLRGGSLDQIGGRKVLGVNAAVGGQVGLRHVL